MAWEQSSFGIIIYYQVYKYAHHVSQADHIESCWTQHLCSGVSLLLHHAVLCLSHSSFTSQTTSLYETNPIHGSASGVNHSGADAQVVICHRYLVIFHLFVDQLPISYISGLVSSLPSSSKQHNPLQTLSQTKTSLAFATPTKLCASH